MDLCYNILKFPLFSWHVAGEGRPVMDWATRVKVAAGAARGIAYLHEDCKFLHFTVISVCFRHKYWRKKKLTHDFCWESDDILWFIPFISCTIFSFIFVLYLFPFYVSLMYISR